VRRAIFLLAVLAATPVAVRAQSSQFGVRGLGMPGRTIGARTFATGGAFAAFDPESGLNPAALGRTTALNASFNVLQDFRHVENPAGTESLREVRFPHVTVAGPLRRYPAVFGLSFNNYTSRDFTLASTDTVDLRGAPVEVNDTLASRGGLSDLGVTGAYRFGDAWSVGGAFHIITGSERLRARRAFGDSTFSVATETTELSYAGIGLSLGVIRNFGPGFSMAASVRSDGKVNVDRDSTRVSTVDLPYTFGFGMRWRARPKLELAGDVVMKTWSGANSDLLAQGGTGSANTVEVSLGGEFTPDPRRPSRRPIRLGARYGTLPFTLVEGEQPHELGVSIGSGVRFAQDRAGIDVGVEHVWRSQGSLYKERAFLIDLAVTVRP
jgi:hypothetical protein